MTPAPATPATPESCPRPGRCVRWAVLLWMMAITAFHLGLAALGKPIYQDIRLGSALEYARGPINLFRPMIVGFNANGEPTPQELPVWQATAALLFKAFGPWFGWANLVSIVFLFSGLYPLYRLAKRFAGENCAWWTLLLFLAQPVVFYYAGETSPDGQTLSTVFWFLFFATKLWEERSLKYLLLTLLTGALAAICKLPFFVAAGLGCFFMTAAGFRQRKAAWIQLGIAALFIGILFLAWTRYVNQCYARAELPFVDLGSSTPGSKFWYFGDLHYRLSPGVWVKGFWRILTTLFGSFAVAGVFLLALLQPSASRLARWWLVGGVVTTLVFFHLVLHHFHYYLMFSAPVALLCAQLFARLETWLHAQGRRGLIGLAVILASLGLGTAQGLVAMHVNNTIDDYPRAMAAIIKQHTSPSDKLLIQGGGWGGNLLFLSDRRGLSIWNTQPLEDPKTYARLKELGFTKLVMVSESPLIFAIKRSTQRTEREVYRGALTPVAEGLPTVLQNDDILIKELP
jgi:hypothetical protein